MTFAVGNKDKFGKYVRTLNSKSSQLGADIKGTGKSPLQNILLYLQKELIPERRQKDGQNKRCTAVKQHHHQPQNHRAWYYWNDWMTLSLIYYTEHTPCNFLFQLTRIFSIKFHPKVERVRRSSWKEENNQSTH